MPTAWDTPIQYLKGVGPQFAKKLEKLEIFTIGDLLTHIPFRYEDYSKIVKIREIVQEEPVTVIASVISAKNTYTKWGKTFQKVVIGDNTGNITCLWFNQPFIVTSLNPGTSLSVSGKAQIDSFNLTFASPDYEVIYNPDQTLRHTGRLVPIYPLTQGVSAKWMRNRLAYLLTSKLSQTEILPEELLDKFSLVKIPEALRLVHAPNTLDEVEVGRKRLAFDEILLASLNAHLRRKQWQVQKSTSAFYIDPQTISEFMDKLPFSLTNAQQKALSEIVLDLKKPQPMNRMLQGDVGSGKTVVAAIAAYIAHLNQKRSLFMAPTEILAFQHFETLNRLFSQHNINVELITSSTQKKLDAHKPRAPVIIGTHALLEDKHEFDNVGFIVVDEQHRFGVSQRSKLRTKGANPHTLTMTATPIPRTIMLTLYGDLDISRIDELPKGRVPIKTRVVNSQNRDRAYDWIRKKIVSTTPRQQVFIVCPFIEPSESLKTVKAAKDEFEKLQSVIFAGFKLGLLHGRLKSSDKNRVLTDFKEGKLDMLVSTPVVEVGIDIPNATIMLIEASERYGLAQLHQLRGRVGRGNLLSFCLLFTTTDDHIQSKRLKALEQSTNGAQLAELDLKIRGPGALFGTAQHGRGVFKIATVDDFATVNQVQKASLDLLKQDPDLKNSPLLKQRLVSSTIDSVSPD